MSIITWSLTMGNLFKKYYLREGGWHAPVGFRFFAIHHWFWGMIIATIGFAMIFELGVNRNVSAAVVLLGLWITADDALQHYIQHGEMVLYGRYRTHTFWHWFPYRVLEWIRRN